MMPSRILVKWTVEGALFGYCVLHPLVMLISYFMSLIYSSHDHPISKNFAAAILGFFSIGMLPWSLAFAIFVALIFLYYKKTQLSNEENKKLIVELQGALEKIKTLSGFLPICASCKKIRDDKGHWNQIEVYIRDHSEAEFTHSLCPECARELYPGRYKDT